MVGPGFDGDNLAAQFGDTLMEQFQEPFADWPDQDFAAVLGAKDHVIVYKKDPSVIVSMLRAHTLLDTKGGSELPNSRKKIEQVAAEIGLTVNSLSYSSPVATGMGDGVGGWLIQTDKGAANGADADGLIEEMGYRFGRGLNDKYGPSLPPSLESEGFQSRGLR